MVTRKKMSDSEALELYRMALTNSKNQVLLAQILASFGYGPLVIEEGWVLYETAQQSYVVNIKEDDETSEASALFKLKKDELAEDYSEHRGIAKIVFSNQPEILKRLQLTGRVPRKYIKWFEMVKKFYTEIQSDEQLIEKLSRFNLNAEAVAQAISLIEAVEAAKFELYREEGESQEATVQKNTDIEIIRNWMNEFFAIARIALKDHPQLLEALGLLVRS